MEKLLTPDELIVALQALREYSHTLEGALRRGQKKQLIAEQRHVERLLELFSDAYIRAPMPT